MNGKASFLFFLLAGDFAYKSSLIFGTKIEFLVLYFPVPYPLYLVNFLDRLAPHLGK